MNHDDKINSLENTPAKREIRNDLCGQTLQYIKQNNIKNFVGVSLPAKDYLFETDLEYRIKNNFGYLKNIPSVQFHCAETEVQTMRRGLKNRPSFCTVSNLNIEELIRLPINFSKEKIGKVQKGFEDDNESDDFKFMDCCGQPTEENFVGNYNFLWADYCQRPTRKVLDTMIESLQFQDERKGLYYFTFSLAHKKINHIIRELNYSPRNTTIDKALEKYIAKSFKTHLYETPKLIYSVVYTGGKNSPMITLGFCIGVNNITTIIDNRKERQSKLKSKNNSLFNKTLANPKKYFKQKKFKGFRQKKQYSNSNLTKQDRQFIIQKFQKEKKLGEDKKTITKKLAKAKRLIKHNVSRCQISAVLAWITSSKLKAKTVN